MVVDVAAGILQRPDGAFLFAQRPAGKVYAGYWEFPGGKVEPGEDAAAALARELREELGIEVRRAYPWIARVFTYPHATVRLHFFRVTAWEGTPRPLEDQAVAWQLPGAPLAEPMLPANTPVLAGLALPPVYAITQAAELGRERMLAALKRRLDAGLKLVGVREPGLPAGEREALTHEILALAAGRGCRVLTKAPFPGAHGVHLTAAELMRLEARPAGELVAASCHTREELERAMSLGLDFAVLGPVKPTRTHPGVAALGWTAFRERSREASIPVYAIGGLAESDLEDAWRAGAHGIAMIRAAWA